MIPRKAAFYVYAESDEQVRELERELHDLVVEQYRKGTLVTAPRLSGLISRYKHNPIITHYLK